MMYLLLIFTHCCLVGLQWGTGNAVENQNENQSEFINRNRRAASLLTPYIYNTVKKQQMLERHNEVRRQVVPQASNMIELTWDTELEDLAKDYSRTCNYPTHRPQDERKTSEFTIAGENMAQSGDPPAGIANASVQAWFDEISYYNYDASTCQSGKVCGHYLQLTWAKSYKVGCGMSLCNNLISGTYRGYMYVCNYGVVGYITYYSGGSSIIARPFKSGPPCSECPENFRNCRKGLCTNDTVKSVDNENEATTIIDTISIDTTSKGVRLFCGMSWILFSLLGSLEPFLAV